MSIYIGLDIGTSSSRAVAVTEKGVIVAIGQCEYDILKPQFNWAEQNMGQIWEATLQAVRRMIAAKPEIRTQIKGIGYSGQMHGLVMVDENYNPIYNAIIWADQRSKESIQNIYSIVPKEDFGRIYANQLSTGFMLPSLIWIREHIPEIYEKIYKIMLPKDYIRYKMCGEIGTDASDASSTGMWNTEKRTWSYEIIDRLKIPRSFFVNSHESYEKAGEITAECADLTGLKKGTFVSYGGGDSLMMELGNGMIGEGRFASNIGTGCNINCALRQPLYDPLLRTNTWCHARENLWALMGAHLSGGVALKWMKTKILKEDSFDNMTAQASTVPAGSEGVLFLPYLNGERTPHNDPNAKAIFLGMNLKHIRAHIIRSVMEGIVFSMKESLEIVRSLGMPVKKIIAAGGAAKSPLFLQIFNDTATTEIYTNSGNEPGGKATRNTQA